MTSSDSIVVCSNCKHDHPLGTCMTEVDEPLECGKLKIPQICGCSTYQPILKPFALTPQEKAQAARRENIVISLVYAVLLIAFLVYAFRSDAAPLSQPVTEPAQWGQPKRQPQPLIYKRLSPTKLSVACIDGTLPSVRQDDDILIVGCPQ